MVRFDTNDYSVPVKYAHRKLIVVATVEEVRLVYEDRLVARHRRCWDRERTFFEPIHYLALLERKPGGFDYARPWRTGRCRRAFPCCDAGWKRPIRVTGHAPTSACSGCWRSSLCHSSPRRSSMPWTST